MSDPERFWIARLLGDSRAFAALASWVGGPGRNVITVQDPLLAVRASSPVELMRQLGAQYDRYMPVCMEVKTRVHAGGVKWPSREDAWGADYAEEPKPEPPPADRSAVQLTDGSPVPGDGGHKALKPNGQQQDYVVLSDAERAKGFVRPYRDAYRHTACGKITTMARAIAETYARDPFFYSGTFCTTCGAHFPVGEDGEFTWYEMDGREGPPVGA